MSGPILPSLGDLPADLVLQVQAACTAFEEEWAAGRRPALEDFLSRAEPPARGVLAAELLRIELAYRRKAGEIPSTADYRQRLAEYATRIDAVFADAGPGADGKTLAPAEAAEPVTVRAPSWKDATPEALAAGPGERVSVPGYEVLGLLGKGGMGVVYKARHRTLNRTVALKMVRAGDLAGPEERLRFLHEAETVAQLHHPNIVQIYEFGEQAAQPFIALEFVAGGSLAQRIKGTPLPNREGAALVEALARGVHAAHLRGVIHRDLKPANVLLTDDGTPKLTDFGLAKRVGAGAGPTITGAVLGTPSYMAPEQAGSQRGAITTLVDVYSLGAILYELLTGQPPFRGATPMDTLVQVLEQAPTPPQALNPQADEDLATVCLKCLSKDPTQRYPSAQALAEELGRWAAGEPIQARPPGLLTVARSLARRHGRAAAWVIAVGLVGGILAGAHTFITDVNTPLVWTAAAYDALPSAPRPWLARIGQSSPWLQAVVGCAMLLWLSSLGLLAVVRTRPRHAAADLAIGLAVGAVAGVAALSCGTGWALIHGTALSGLLGDPEVRALIETGLQAPQERSEGGRRVFVDEYGQVTPAPPPGWQLDRYPELRDLPLAKQTDLLHRKVRAELVIGVQKGIGYSLLAVAGFILLGACEAVAAGALLRRRGRVRSILVPYAEMVGPGVVGVYAVIVLAVNLLAQRDTFRPITWGTVLALAVAALIAAARRWPAAGRLVLHAAWLLTLAAILSEVWPPHAH
jgi:hypothetical protein